MSDRPHNPSRTRAAIVPALVLLTALAAPRAPARQDTPPAPPPAPAPPQPADQPAEKPADQPAEKPAQPSAPALEPYEGRLIREVRVEGLVKVGRQMVENQIRSRAGTPLSRAAVEQDIQRLTHLGRFRTIDASVTSFDDKSVALVYRFEEAPMIIDVQATGNRQVSDTELAKEISLLKDTAVDQFELDRAVRRIKDLYRKKGYYQADVTIDEAQLEKTGIVVFKIREGERIKVTDIRFEPAFGGSLSFSNGQLRPNLKTRTAGLFDTGPLDDEALDQDVTALISYYQDRGYLDVRVGRRITEAPNRREAIVTFVIAEGPVYTLRSVRVELDNGLGESSGQPPHVFTPEQIAGLMHIKAGDVYSADKIRKSVTAVQEAYGRLGYVDARASKTELRDLIHPQVDLLILATEGRAFRMGLPLIQGNDLTKQSVILRRLEVHPDRPLDTTALRQSKDNLENSRLFEPQSTKITIQPEDESRPGYRDVLVEVKETNTGSIGFGASLNSDLGIAASISLTQRNFDATDFPDSFGEFFAGRAFRGGGQTFDLRLEPGTEHQLYSISLADPNIFGTDYAASIQGHYSVQQHDDYDENRLGGAFGIGRQFGERWSARLNFRVDNIDLRDIDPDAPVDVFAVEDPHLLTGIGLSLRRFTADNTVRPTRGTDLRLAVEQVGAMGGDFDFTKLSAEHTFYIPVYETFLGRRTVLSVRTSVGYIPQDESAVPVYERFYLGGRNFRGFDYRTVSPKGIRNDTGTQGNDPVGGTWSFFFGTEIEQPLWQDMISGVAFVDTGTVINNPGFDAYRVSVGVGVRLYIKQLGPVPLAFDFAFPILKEDLDEDRLFSFSLDLPF